jgi:hypothetical protein
VSEESIEPAARTLRQQVVSGVGWKIATVAVVQVTRIVVGVILARLLVPRDFGLASIAGAMDSAQVRANALLQTGS